MQLVGFKDKSYLKVYHNIKHSMFVYPDDKKSKGSSQLTDAMLKELVKANKVAIVKFAPRDNCQVRFCALVPQEEKIGKDGFVQAAGF